MNNQERKKTITANWRKYNIPRQSRIHMLKRNAININRGNTIEHERYKVDLAFEMQHFITEAERSLSEEEKQQEFYKGHEKKIVDFVDLTTGSEFEIIHKHESDIQIEFYRKQGIIPMIVGESITCSKCTGKFPRRNKGNICQICKAEAKNGVL